MMRIRFILVETAAAAVFLVPVFLILNRVCFHQFKRTAACSLFSFYLAAVFALVGIPNITYVNVGLNLNMIPLAGMLGDLKNSILNVLLFVPLGVMLPLLWEGWQERKRAVLFGFGLSLFIELLQMLTLRATDVNDLITNTLGAFLGTCVTEAILKRWRIPGAGQGNRRELYTVCGITFGVMFFLQPFVSGLFWKWILQ